MRVLVVLALLLVGTVTADAKRIQTAPGDEVASLTDEPELELALMMDRPESPGRCACAIYGVLLLFPIAAIILAIGAFIRSANRRRKLRSPGEPTSPLVAEAMTRSVIDYTVVVIMTASALALALYLTDEGPYAAAIMWIPLTRLVRLAVAHKFLGILERTGAPAEMHDNILSVRGKHIVVPRSIARGARLRAVPAARTR